MLIRMSEPKFFDSVLFVIVLYKRTLKDVPAYQTVQSCPGAQMLYVYDNSPEAQPVTSSAIIYHHDKRNPGVSRAYNSALAVAQRLNKTWLLLLDQDTQIPQEALSSYAQAVAAFTSHHIFTLRMRDGERIVSPYRQVFGRGRSVRNVSPGPLPLSRFHIINSGMLIRSSIFSAAGGYDEDFPLDFSDVAFCDRLKKVVDTFVVAEGNGIHHLSGNDPTISINDGHVRFAAYAEAAMLYQRKYNSAASAFYLIFLRALRLFFRYRQASFLMLGWRKAFT
jgi:rhamnosyltransferase